MKKCTLYVAFIAVFLFPMTTEAGPVVRVGETVSVDASQEVKGDFYGFGSKIIISGANENDAYLCAGTVTINAPTQQDLSIIGGSVQVHGDVGDDLRIIGGDVVVGNVVKGDVVVVGGSLTILSTASVHGDVLFYGGELTIDGPIIGAVHGSAESVRIDTEVGGDITLDVASQFSLGSNAKTLGTITYESTHDLVRAQDAETAHDPYKVGKEVQKKSFPITSYLLGFSILCFATILFFVVMRKQVRTVAHVGATRIGLSGLIGLGVALSIPFVSAMLMVSVIGIFAGSFLFVGYLTMLCGACILSPISLGYLLQFYLKKQETLTFMTVLGGVVAWMIIGSVPIVGVCVLFVYFVVTLGALSLTIYERLRA